MSAKKSAPSDQSPVAPSTVAEPEFGAAAMVVGAISAVRRRTPAPIAAADRIDRRVRRCPNPRIETS
jgi:hypothetical protein